MKTRVLIPLLVIASVLLADQTLKIWVKTNMRLGEEIFIFDWFRLHFVENYGIAWGIDFGVGKAKVALTLLRMVLTALFAYLLYRAIRVEKHMAKVLALAFIVAGATGNLIDSVFYGVLFTESTPLAPARFLPGSGYTGWLKGAVVDMLFFPLLYFKMPEWVPAIGGEQFLFFAPVFNIADASITIGFFLWLAGELLTGRKHH